MISAKLISEVTGSEFEKCYISKNGKEVNCYYPKGSEYNHAVFNIYELAHMCKELTMNNYDFYIMSDAAGYCEIQNGCHEIKNIVNDISEPEAIFKACEWILEQQK